MSEHTPGPWQIYHDGWDLTSVADKTGHIVTTQVEGRAKAEMLANARLIAAAPDLLKELVAVWDALDAFAITADSTALHKWAANRDPKARAAIDKAKGEQS